MSEPTGCTCGAAHPWREHGFDDPAGLSPIPAAFTEWANEPAFAGTEHHPLEHTVEKKTAFHTRWFQQETPKDLIVLHYTEGEHTWSPAGCWQVCNGRFRVAAEGATQHPPSFTRGVGSTAFGITGAGQIEQYFPPECWSHSSTAGRGGVHPRVVAIELFNLGWIAELRNAAGEFVGYRSRCRWYGKELPEWLKAQVVPADAIPDENKASLPAHFETIPWTVGGQALRHRIKYWHRFPAAQIRALIDLVDALCDRFGIPRAALPEDQRASERWRYGVGCTFRGIVSHINFVQAGEPGVAGAKWDLGPAFPWRELLTGIGAPLGTRTQYRVRAEFGAAYVPYAELAEEAPSATVQHLERYLTYLGYNCGAADGIRDAHTRRGIRAFQSAEGMPVDGRITAALCETVRARYLEEVTRRHTPQTT